MCDVKPTALPVRVSMTSLSELFISTTKENSMNRIVYLIGAVVVIIALLSFFGLR